jgi:hypothetical protein
VTDLLAGSRIAEVKRPKFFCTAAVSSPSGALLDGDR